MTSCVIPYYNLAKMTETVCDACKGFEIVLVDNGSTEHPEASGAVRVGLYDRFVWASSANTGAKAASGDTLVFLHNDVSIDRTTVRLLASEAQGMALSTAVPALSGSVACWAFAISRQLYDAIGGFDVRYMWYGWDGYDIAVSVLSSGGTIKPVCVVGHARAATMKTVMATCTAKQVSCRDAVHFSSKWGFTPFPISEEESKTTTMSAFNNAKTEYWRSIMNRLIPCH